MPAHLFVILLLALLPGVSWAQPAKPVRSTPLEISSTMTVCFQNMRQGVYTLHGTQDSAFITEERLGQEPWLFAHVWRGDSPSGDDIVIERDPITSPLRITFAQDGVPRPEYANELYIRELARYMAYCLPIAYPIF